MRGLGCFRIGVSLGLMVVLSACAGLAEPTTVPTGRGWDAEIQDAVKYADSDFEREAFADGVITREEYEEAHTLFLACMDQTYPPDGQIKVVLTKDSSGFYRMSIVGFTSPEGDPLVDQVVMECEAGTVNWIAPLYEGMTINPQNRPWLDLIIECLIREGVVDPSYDQEDYYRDAWGGELGALDEFTACQMDPRPKGGS